MKKVFIKYDPYEMKSTIKVDGKEIQKNKHCDYKLKKYLEENINMPMPIQAWIDPIERDGWKGLLAVLCDMGDRDIEVEFSGRKIDYEWIQASLNAQNRKLGKKGVKLEFCELTEEIVPDSEMKKNIDEVIKLMLTADFEKIVEASHSKELQEKYNCLKESYDEINAEEFRIVFTGVYSSGKSSTINALIGKNLLPTAHGTCTAKICRIIHDANVKCLAKVQYEYNDEYNNKKESCFCERVEDVQDKIKAAGNSVERIEVYTDLSSLYPDEVQSDFKIVIVDTPGTDSAIGNDTEKSKEEVKRLSEKSHLEITKEVLASKQKEMVVLVSGENVEGKNIRELLDIIEESVERDYGAFNDRFLFVMNKCDAISYGDGGTLENIINNFITNIKRVSNPARIRNIVNPRVFPIASGVALAVVNGYITRPKEAKPKELYNYYKQFCDNVYDCDYDKLDKLEDGFEQLINYDDFCLEKYSAVSEATKYKYVQMLEGKLSLPERALIHSGVPALKNAIQEYIKIYAYPIKIRQLLRCFNDILCELNSFNQMKLNKLEEEKKSYECCVSEEKKKKEKEAQEKKRKETLESIRKKMDCIKKEVDQIEETIMHPYSDKIDKVRAGFFGIENNYVEKYSGEVPKDKAKQIIWDISQKLDSLLKEIKIIIDEVKEKKKKDTDVLYNKFISYLNELESAGLMDNDGFSLKDTVAYKDIVDKESFTKAKEYTRNEANPNKNYLDYNSIIGFFNSIGPFLATLDEPDTIEKTYIDLGDYLSTNICPIRARVDTYFEEVKDNYKSDIQLLKIEAKKRIDRVVTLIKEKGECISAIEKEISEIENEEKGYSEKIEKIEKNIKDLGLLISKIEYMRR